MSDFTYDGVSLPAVKTDTRPVTTRSTLTWAAADYNSLRSAILSLRTALLAGDYHGLATNPGEPVSDSGTAKIRFDGSILQYSLSGGAWTAFGEGGGGGGGASLGDDVPLIAGVAAAGAGTLASRQDHIHPAQTSVSGNSGTATRLATARNINGTAFDGSADITIADSTKVVANGAITGATKTKITYDTKGLVTSGADATTADIADSTDKRYVTDAQRTVIGNTSGTNTGDQTSVSGNAGTATRLATARNIAGLSFDGTADITPTTANIADSTDKRYVTDAQRTVIGNTSGTNTGDVTLGTASGLSFASQVLSLALATTTSAGAMSAAYAAKLEGLWVYVAPGANAATLQAAIATLSGNGTLFLGSGTYPLAGTGLTADGNIIIRGCGPTATVITYTGTGAAIQINSGTGVESLSAGVRDLTLDGTSASSGGAVGISLGQASVSPLSGGGTFENLIIKRFSTAGVRLVVSILARWNSIRFEGNKDGIWFDPTNDNGITTQFFNGCRFYNNTQRGAYICSGDQITFSGCYFERNSREGALIEQQGGSTTVLRGVTFDNCYVEANNQAASTYPDINFTNLSSQSHADMAVRRTRFQATNSNGNLVFNKGTYLEENNTFSPVSTTNVICGNTSVCFAVTKSYRDPSTYVTAGSSAVTTHIREGNGVASRYGNVAGVITQIVSDSASGSQFTGIKLGTRATTSLSFATTARDGVLLTSAASGAVTVGLVNAVTQGAGQIVSVIKTDATANVITVDGAGSQTIGGQLTRALTSQGDYIHLISDGTNWLISSMDRTGTAAPTTGTWAVGEFVRNTTPTSDTVLGWVCTVAGTPGTWVPCQAITASAQSIAGAKTFTGAISASNLSGTNTGDTKQEIHITLLAPGTAITY